MELTCKCPGATVRDLMEDDALAFVIDFTRADGRTLRVQPTHVTCTYSFEQFDAGKKILQLDTHGSSTRAIPGKVSQTLQFDEARARILFDVLREVFGFR